MVKVALYKKYFCIIVLLLIVTNHAKATRPSQRFLDSVALKWVPDKRVGICKLTVEKSKGKYMIHGETTEMDAILEVYATLNMPQRRIVDKIKLLPDASLGNKIHGLVKVGVMNMRKNPRHQAELLSQAVLGTPIRILKDSNNYLLIQTPDKYIGWVSQSSVQRLSKIEMEHWKQANRALFVSRSGYVYADTLKTTVVTDIVMTSICKSIETVNAWTKIELPDQKIGFVKTSDLVDFSVWANANKTLQHAELVQMAYAFMGTSYLWGGTSSYMFDCSGFIKTVYFMQGVVLPRDASQQCKIGYQVDVSENYEHLLPGDLLFFGSKTSKNQHITHVGMYIGNNEFIHESEWIHLSSMHPAATNYCAYYHKRLIMARRITHATHTADLLIHNAFYF